MNNEELIRIENAILITNNNISNYQKSLERYSKIVKKILSIKEYDFNKDRLLSKVLIEMELGKTFLDSEYRNLEIARLRRKENIGTITTNERKQQVNDIMKMEPNIYEAEYKCALFELLGIEDITSEEYEEQIQLIKLYKERSRK